MPAKYCRHPGYREPVPVQTEIDDIGQSRQALRNFHDLSQKARPRNDAFTLSGNGTIAFTQDWQAG
ncbi:MAG: hypothetical protein ACJ8AW_02235 [Rhodopila sp.]